MLKFFEKQKPKRKFVVDGANAVVDVAIAVVDVANDAGVDIDDVVDVGDVANVSVVDVANDAGVDIDDVVDILQKRSGKPFSLFPST